MPLAVAFMLWSTPASAHDVELTKVSATFQPGGRYQIDVYYDVNAWVLGLPPQHLRPDDLRRLSTLPVDETQRRLDELRDFVQRGIRVRFDEQKIAPAIDFVETPDRPTTQPVVGALLRSVRLTGSLPPGAKSFDFWASRSFGNIVLLLRREGNEDITQQLLERGERSRPFWLSAPPNHSGWRVARQYLRLGFEHILPKGLDHILFVLGLFLLGDRLRPLLWQVTAFTLAHSVSLALSTYGVVSVSPRIVEPLIALSIACVAVENVCTWKLHAWRPAVVFVFGLLHGLGFAGVLSELGLPRNQFATALVSFNIGVELGQISVIALAMLAVGWFRNRAWYRARIVVPCSLLIAGTGLYWTIQRAMA